MSKFLLWICIGVFGGVFSLLPMLWGSSDIFLITILSTVGGIVGIWVWYRWFRYT